MSLKEFSQAMVNAFGNMDVSTLTPMSNFVFHPLFDKEWVNQVETMMQNAEDKQVSREKIAELFTSITHIRSQLFFLLLDLKSAKISKERRMKIADFLHDILLIRGKHDPYGHMSNRHHSHKDIHDILARKFLDGSPEAATELGKLYAAAYHLVNGLYTDFYTDFSVENYGPYHLDNERMMVIKEFQDIRPDALWPGIQTPCKKLTIYTIYKNVEFKCDAISCHSHYTGNTINGLVAWRLEADGKEVSDIEEIMELTEQMASLAEQQWITLTDLDKESLKIKGLEMRGYVLGE